MSAALLVELLSGPDLTGATCSGRAPFWDGPIIGEAEDVEQRRQEAAVLVCQQCPVLERCEDLLWSLPKTAAGVWAGRVLTGKAT